MLCKILWKVHCACQSSLKFCSSNKLIPEIPGFATTKVCFSAHLACPTQVRGRLCQYSDPGVHSPPSQVFEEAKKEIN